MKLSVSEADLLLRGGQPVKALECVRRAIAASDPADHDTRTYGALKVDEINCLVEAGQPTEAVEVTRAELAYLLNAPKPKRAVTLETRRAIRAAGIRAVDALLSSVKGELSSCELARNAEAVWDQALWFEGNEDSTGAVDALMRLRAVTVDGRFPGAERLWARASYEYAIVLSNVERVAEAIQSWEEVFDRTSGRDPSELVDIGHRAAVSAAREWLELERWADALSGASRIRELARNGTPVSSDARSRALNIERDALAGMGDARRAGAVDEEIVALFGEAADDIVRQRAAQALAHGVWAAVTLHDRAAVRDRLRRLEETFTREREPAMAQGVARWVLDGARYAARTSGSRWSRRHDRLVGEAIAVHQRLIANLRARSDIDNSVVVDALVSLGTTLQQTGHITRAVDQYEAAFTLSTAESEHLAERLARAKLASTDEYLALAIVSAVSLRDAGRKADGLQVLDELLTFMREQPGARKKATVLMVEGLKAWIATSSG